MPAAVTSASTLPASFPASLFGTLMWQVGGLHLDIAIHDRAPSQFHSPFHKALSSASSLDQILRHHPLAAKPKKQTLASFTVAPHQPASTTYRSSLQQPRSSSTSSSSTATKTTIATQKRSHNPLASTRQTQERDRASSIPSLLHHQQPHHLTTTNMAGNIVIAIIIIVLFVVLALIGFLIYWAQTSIGGVRGSASETSGEDV